MISLLPICTNLMRTLSAPKGVTKVAGAKAQAAKFAASPNPTVEESTFGSDGGEGIKGMLLVSIFCATDLTANIK